MASRAAVVISSRLVTRPKLPNFVCPTPIIPTSLIFVHPTINYMLEAITLTIIIVNYNYLKYSFELENRMVINDVLLCHKS